VFNFVEFLVLFSAIVLNTASVKLHLKIISTFILLDSLVNRYSEHLYNERSLQLWLLRYVAARACLSPYKPTRNRRDHCASIIGRFPVGAHVRNRMSAAVVTPRTEMLLARRAPHNPPSHCVSVCLSVSVSVRLSVLQCAVDRVGQKSGTTDSWP